MKISIAGAGAGKTTKMADRIIARYTEIDKSKNIYCVSFTNNAVTCIKKKLKEHFDLIPAQIHVETIHSFLYQEIIKPYYYLLFKKSFDHISSIDLGDPKYKAYQIKKLEDRHILHVEAITQKALWLFVKRSNDNKSIRDKRKIIQAIFAKYCGGIFIDEAQDIDKNFYDIIVQLEKLKLFLEAIGDPKQDLRGRGMLRKMVEEYQDRVTYIKECHRCPEKHLKVSNFIINKGEWQSSEIDEGSFYVCFERNINVRQFIQEKNFDLKYIYQKNERFDTHNQITRNVVFDSLNNELYVIFKELYKDDNELNISRRAYYGTSKLIQEYKKGSNAKEIIKKCFPSSRFESTNYAKLCTALNLLNGNDTDLINVNSIESIKGQEGETCLFILTTVLAAYLFGEKKQENKVKCALYVALTRSLNKMTILVTTEVEEKYTREKILEFFKDFSVILLV